MLRNQNYQEDGEKVRGKIVRPNIECTDGYIHLVDTAMLDNSPPWTLMQSGSWKNMNHLLILPIMISIVFLMNI